MSRTPDAAQMMSSTARPTEACHAPGRRCAQFRCYIGAWPPSRIASYSYGRARARCACGCACMYAAPRLRAVCESVRDLLATGLLHMPAPDAPPGPGAPSGT